jgi:hypothetical protein
MSFKYSFPATTLSDPQYHNIMAPVLLAGLANAPMCRNFPRTLIHVPSTSIRAGIPDLFTTQGLAHIDSMLTHGQSRSLTGQLLRVAFEAFIIECGIGRMVCNPVWEPMVMVMTDCWVKETMIFLQSQALGIHHHLDTPILCNNDIHIIAYWMKEGDTVPQLEHMNRCCLCVQVVNLSEVVTCNGQAIM